MSLDSLYGGKQGISFVLRGNFPSVDDMVSAFKRGSSYADVYYGEYCIIDTPNKNDEDNGKIYRRGLEYQNSMGGAEYVGQVVGPSSGTPYLQLLSIDDVKKISQQTLDEYEYRRYPYEYDEDSEQFLTTDGIAPNPTQGIGTFEFNKNYDETLIPGKYVEEGETKYNDSILFTWCNVRKDNADSDSWFYVGWQQPYLVTDYSIHMTSPYDASGNILTDATEIERIDDNSHPFYEHWDLGLPKGVKGDTLRNLRVITPTAGNKNNIYDASAITVDPTTGETKLGNAGYAGIDDDIASGRQIVVFDYYVYDKLRNPSPIMIYLGDFNIITNISVDDEGTLTVEYTHEDDSVFTKKIRWVNAVSLTEGNGTAGGHITFTFNNDVPSKTQEFDISWIKGIEIEEDGSLLYTYAGTPDTLPDDAVRTAEGIYRVEDFLQWIHNVTLDSQNGHFTVTNNRDQTIFQTDLDWIRDIDFAADGTVTLTHTSQSPETYQNLIKWINSVTLSQNTGQFTINWNYGDPTTFQLDWIDDVFINEETGDIYIHHTRQNRNAEYDDYTGDLLDAKLKLITSASVTSDGVITLYTNTGESIQVNGQGSEQPFKIKIIENIELLTGIRDDKHIRVKYNTESTAEEIGDPINYIQDMVVRASDWHLLVLYNDPEHRVTSAEELDEDNKDSAGVAWYNNIVGSDGKSYSANDIYWRDMGAIKDQAGILIGFNLDSSTVEDSEFGTFDPNIAGSAVDGTGVCGYLQAALPNGLTGDQNSGYGIGTKEKIVAYTPPLSTDNPDKQDKEFYAYDYNTGHWFYLGKIADSGMRDARLKQNTEATSAAEVSKVSTEGLMFKWYAVNKSDAGIDKFWDKTYTWN